MMRRVHAVLAIGALAAAVSGCGAAGGSATGLATPTTPALAVVLATPNADDGAVMFTVAGARIDSITAEQGYALDSAGAPGATRRVIVQGAIAAGPIAHVWAAAGTQPAALTASVTQVAQRGTYAQRAIAGYAVTVR